LEDASLQLAPLVLAATEWREMGYGHEMADDEVACIWACLGLDGKETSAGLCPFVRQGVDRLLTEIAEETGLHLWASEL
jgi:hypothetical protein